MNLHNIGVQRLEIVQQVLVSGKARVVTVKGLTALNTLYNGFARVKNKLERQVTREGVHMPGSRVMLEVLDADGKLIGSTAWKMAYCDPAMREAWKDRTFMLRIATSGAAGIGANVLKIEVEHEGGARTEVKLGNAFESAGVATEWQEPSRDEFLTQEYESLRDCVRRVRRRATLDEAYHAAKALLAKWAFYATPEGAAMGVTAEKLEAWRGFLSHTGGYDLAEVVAEAGEIVEYKERGIPLPARSLTGARLDGKRSAAPQAQPQEIPSPNLAAWTPLQVARLLDGYGEIRPTSDEWAVFLSELEKREGTAVRRLVAAEAEKRVAAQPEGAL